MIALALSVLCLAMNAFFVAAEFALVKVHVTKLEPRARRGERRAVHAKLVLRRLDRYLSVTQFGITVASLGLGWLGEPALERLFEHAFFVATGAPAGAAGRVVAPVLGLAVLTFLHLLLGELVPKFIAIQHSEKTTLNAAIPLRLVNAAFRPVLWVLEKAQRAVLRLIRIDPDIASEGAMSEDELIYLLAASAARDPRLRDKQRLLERVLRFARRPVRNAMVPRVDIVALDIDVTGGEAVEFLREQAFSRVPLTTSGSLDEIAGYLYAKDILFDRRIAERASLRGLERRVLFVPETRDGLSVLRDLQTERVPMAIVVDEYGGTSGLVTVEDLVEEIVGDIRDETDVENERVVKASDAPPTWIVDARTTTDELRERGLPIEEEIAGQPIGKLMMARLGHLPRVGDAVGLSEGVLAEVVATHRRRVERVRVRVLPEPAS